MSKFSKKLKSIFGMKCPACLKGDLFLTKNPYRLKGLYTMPENCSCCGEKFTPEPGFYFGAMYVSYGLTVGIAIAVMVANSLFQLDLSIFNKVVLIGSLIFLSIPILFRISRSIWINIFVAYKGSDCISKTD